MQSILKGPYLPICGWILFALLNLSNPSIGFSQQSAPKSTSAYTTRLKFSAHMDKATDLFNWSKVYFKSFRKTNEVAYLNLAADYAIDAVKTLLDLETKTSRRTKFYYQAKYFRSDVCEYYESIRQYSMRLVLEYQLKPIEPALCVR